LLEVTEEAEEVAFRDMVVTVEIIDVESCKSEEVFTLQKSLDLALVCYIVQRRIEIEKHAQFLSYHLSITLAEESSQLSFC
jgi:hypothetical protein